METSLCCDNCAKLTDQIHDQEEYMATTDAFIEYLKEKEQKLMSELTEVKGQLGLSKDLLDRMEVKIQEYGDLFHEQETRIRILDSKMEEKENLLIHDKEKELADKVPILQIRTDVTGSTLQNNIKVHDSAPDFKDNIGVFEMQAQIYFSRWADRYGEKVDKCLANAEENLQKMFRGVHNGIKSTFNNEKAKVEQLIDDKLKGYDLNAKDKLMDLTDEVQNLEDETDNRFDATEAQLTKIRDDMNLKFLESYADEVMNLEDNVEDHGKLLQKMIINDSMPSILSVFISSSMKPEALKWRNPDQNCLCSIGLALSLNREILVKLLSKLVDEAYIEEAKEDIETGKWLPKLLSCLFKNDINAHGQFLANVVKNPSASDLVLKIIKKRLLPEAAEYSEDEELGEWFPKLLMVMENDVNAHGQFLDEVVNNSTASNKVLDIILRRLSCEAIEYSRIEGLANWLPKLLALPKTNVAHGRFLDDIANSTSVSNELLKLLLKRLLPQAMEYSSIGRIGDWLPKLLDLPENDLNAHSQFFADVATNVNVPNNLLRVINKRLLPEAICYNDENLQRYLSLALTLKDIDMFGHASLVWQMYSSNIPTATIALIQNRLHPENIKYQICSSFIKFDPEKSSPSDKIQIQFGDSIRHLAKGCHGGCLNVGISSGRISWEIEMEMDSDNDGTRFGVTEWPIKNWSHKAKDTKSYVVTNDKGNIYWKGKSQNRAVGQIGTHDIVKFDLDMNDGTCELSVNGESKGIVFEGLTGTIYPCVLFKYAQYQKVTLRSFLFH
eukprot:TRINITY_DN779930_c0_g1_i1.p1 TRINITY_DN779930_c0_g1~~TRINITY_DN779930_c0_g1_i1.p1  ORF type:complete len:782 (+),score=193.17 TRINITY_DN779930_c0_g1_i1:163-2508(+)